MHRTRLPRPRSAAAAAILLALPAMTGCIAIPRLEEALAEAAAPAQTTKVYDANGDLITELHAEENREVIPLAEVPDHVRDAVLAIEDARFYHHPGIDFRGVIRAITRNAAEGKVVEGGSTITQQLVKNTLIDNEKTLERKVREAMLAYQLEQRFSKDQILERYLNTVYFGRGAYGIETAAHTFFGKRAADLAVHEGALLAGFIRSPSRFDPDLDPNGARARRNTVLQRMLAETMIDDRTYARARRIPLVLQPKQEKERYRSAYFVDYVKDLIFDDAEQFEMLGATRAERINSVFKGGLRIYTTLDPRLQKAAERAAKRALPYKSDPYTAFVGIRPTDGAVTAMVGGRDFFARKDRFAKFNLAVKSRRQPGSSFKPFTLIAALEKGIPLTRVYRGGSRITLRLPNGTYWSPRNYEGNNFGSSLTLKRATALSVNVVYAQVVLEVGADKVVDVARRMGVTAPLESYPSISLGTEEISPLDLASAYATIANNGVRIPPTPVRKITNAEGKTLYEAKPEKKRVLSEPVAALATEALVEVMKTGTGRRLQLGRPAAGKTGTSEEYSDAWFAGFTPQMVGVSWVGFPRSRVPMRPPRTRIRVFGSSWPGQMWREFMIEAHKGLPEQEFPVAKELLVKVRVDTLRNCLPNEYTPNHLIQVKTYMKGSEPKEKCTEPKSATIKDTPDVVGKSAVDARAILQRAGFAVFTASQYCPAFREGRVCDQTPEPGTRSTLGTRATIYVSNDRAITEVPMVLGRTLARARDKLIEAGYRVKVVRRENSDSYAGCRDLFEEESGRVWAQSPCSGANYGRGSTVTLYVNP